MIQYKAGERHGAKHLNPFYLNMERMTHIMEEQKNLIWKDRKRVLGMPLTFTKYSLSEDRIFLQTGFLNLEEEEILLYRVRDLSVKRSLKERIHQQVEKMKVERRMRLGELMHDDDCDDMDLGQEEF